MPTLIEDQATLARLVPMLNAAVTEGQHGLPRLGVETFLSIRDKRRQELVGKLLRYLSPWILLYLHLYVMNI